MTAAVATVKGGFFEVNGVPSLSSISGRSGAWRRIRQYLGDEGMMRTRALMLALDGVVPGSNATKTLTRIQASSELGGKRVIETKTIVNRNTAAGDVTDINNNLLTLTSKTSYGASPVANKDRNPLGTR